MWISFLLKKFFTSSINSIVGGYLTQKKLSVLQIFTLLLLRMPILREEVSLVVYFLLAIGLQLKAGQRSV